MSSHFYLPVLSLVSTFLVVGGAFSRRYPELRRPIGLTAGTAFMVLGLFLPLVFGAPALYGWCLAASGAMLTLGAALDWLPTDPEDAPMRPARRPLRHFGEAP